ncbi:MAG: HlyD family efflux transporter periplasmic adaptor subunit [Eubacteriales bacterium]|nr:HlyD family efflux transporter periplasmic adaptor subunit [Eubacteriales bacterium]
MAKGREKPAKKGRKKSRKKIAAGALAGVLVMGGIGAGVYAKVNRTGNVPQEIKTAQSASAQLGSISNTIIGTGNLELQEAEALTVPSGIKIQEVLVESGDVIAKGETLATVDEASVLKAVEETQEEIKELDEQISECQEDEDEDCIETGVAGRVKMIYTAAGDEVTDVMLEHGALMVLSLDGKMAVDLAGVSGAEEGGIVTVVLSSGTEVTGTVESVSGNSYTVTVTDNGTLYGDTVTVTNSDGTLAGEGTLYIHQPLEVTGTVGTVESVDVSENESVSAGAQLLTLEGTASQSQYQELLAEREARSQTLKKLLLLTKDQRITAQAGGTIQSVNIAASSSASSADTSASGSSSGTVSSASSGVKVSQMSYTSGRSTAPMVSLSFTDGCGEAVQQDISEVINDPQAAESVSGAGQAMETAASQTLMLMVQSSGECTASGLAVEAPGAGNTPVTEVAASDGSYAGIVTWNPADTVFAESADYQALVVLWAGEGYQFDSDSIQGADVGTISGVSVSQDGKTLEFQIAYPRTGSSGSDDPGNDSGHDSGDSSGDNAAQDEEDGSQNGGGEGESGFTGGDNAGEGGNGEGSSGQGGSGNSSSGTGGSDGNSENGGSSGQGSSGSGSFGTSQSGTGQSSSGTQSGSGTQNSSSQSASGTASAEDGEKTSSEISASAYSTDVTAFTISPDDYMQLSVNVDELDINSVEEGQKAVVTFDAIEDEEFEGEVTGIGNTASVNGGVAKYTVSLTILKDDRMREGMNASATITIESKENVITLPMTALQEQGSRVFVYTQQSEDGTLSGEKEVSTGLSDGSTVEISEGLSEGDTVYYNRTGNIQGGSSGQNSGFGDMGGFGGGMGDFGGDSGSRPDRSGGSSGGMGGGNPGQGGGTPPGM